jgi:membrane protein
VTRRIPTAARTQVLGRLRDSFPGRCAASFLELQGIDRAMAIAAQAFTALVPLLLLVSALSPLQSDNAAARALINRFRLTGESARLVEEVFARPTPGSVGVMSFVLLLISGVSFTRRVQRMYQSAWHLPPRPGLRGSLNAAAGLGALVLEVLLLSSVTALVRNLPGGSVLAWPISVAASLLLWTSIPWLLLDRRIHWRRLIPAGALAAFCAGAYGAVTSVYMPQLIESYSQRFGLFGVTLSLIGWLVATAMIVVAATVVAAEFDRSEEPWARSIRDRLAGRSGRGDGDHLSREVHSRSTADHSRSH